MGRYISFVDASKILHDLQEEDIIALLDAIERSDCACALDLLQQWSLSVSDECVLDNLLKVLYKIMLEQRLPSFGEYIRDAATRIDANSVQWYYQTVLETKKDMPYTPHTHMALEVCVLRMIDFKPIIGSPDIEDRLQSVMHSIQEVKTIPPSVPVQPSLKSNSLSRSRVKPVTLSIPRRTLRKEPILARHALTKRQKLSHHISQIKDRFMHQLLSQYSFCSEKDEYVVCYVLTEVSAYMLEDLVKELHTFFNKKVQVEFLKFKGQGIKPRVIHYEVKND